MWKLIRLIVLSFLFLSEVAWAKNSFLVAPGRVDFDMSRPGTQSFIVTNNGDGRIRLTIKPIYFAIDSTSLAAGRHLNSETAKIEDLSSYIRVAPKTISLNPQQRRDIRISLRAPASLGEGDYRAHLLVSMLDIAHTVNSKGEGGSEGVGMQLNIKMETAVAVYGHKGERAPQIDVVCQASESGKTVDLKITNASKWRFDGELHMINKKNKEVLAEEYLVSLRESESVISTEVVVKRPMDLKLQWKVTDAPELLGTSNCRL